MGSFQDVDSVTRPAETTEASAVRAAVVDFGVVDFGVVDFGVVDSGVVEAGAVGAEPQSVAAELAALSGLPLSEHAVVFELLHTRLQSALSAIDA